MDGPLDGRSLVQQTSGPAWAEESSKFRVDCRARIFEIMSQSCIVDPQTCRPEHPLGRACRAGTQAAEARPELSLHRAAELLSSRCTSDAGHHSALQAGETSQQLALPGLHHWCTAVLPAASRGPAGGVQCTAHLADPSLPACRGLSLGHARYG